MSPDVFVLRHSRRPGVLRVYGPASLDRPLGGIPGAWRRRPGDWEIPDDRERDLRRALRGRAVRWPTNRAPTTEPGLF